MKIIDLLNKIAKGENPKKIKYYDDVYEFDCYEGEWGYVNKEYCRYKWFANEIDCDLQEQLNDEVEIIEEDKKIEKLDHLIGYDIRQFEDLREYIEITTNDLFGKTNKIIDKINEIIDKLNKEEE